MAATNQRNRPGGNKRSGGRHTNGREAASKVSDKLADVRAELAGYASQGAERFGYVTRGHEGQAVLIALAAGFGVGLVIGCSLASSHQRPRRWNDRITAEGIGRRIMERVESLLPGTITEHFAR